MTCWFFDEEEKPKELGAVGINLKQFRVDGIQAIGTSAERLTQMSFPLIAISAISSAVGFFIL